jgi:hypothetical protein
MSHARKGQQYAPPVEVVSRRTKVAGLVAGVIALLFPAAAVVLFLWTGGDSVAPVILYPIGLVALVPAFMLGARRGNDGALGVTAIVLASIAVIPQLAAVAIILAVAFGEGGE